MKLVLIHELFGYSRICLTHSASRFSGSRCSIPALTPPSSSLNVIAIPAARSYVIADFEGIHNHLTSGTRFMFNDYINLVSL